MLDVESSRWRSIPVSGVPHQSLFFMRGFASILLGVVLLAFFVPMPCEGQGIGWRNDGTGIFTGVTPPTTWSHSQNIRWRVPMKGPTNSSPVAAGGVVFTTSEPTHLLALDSLTGEVLWTAPHLVLPSLSPVERKEVEALLLAAEKAEAAVGITRRDLNRVNRQHRYPGADAGVLRERERVLGRKLSELEPVIAKAAPYRLLQDKNIVGYSSPTPVTDGKHVYAVFGNGVISSHSLDGRQEWIRWLGPAFEPMYGYPVGSASSPVLVDGVLVVGYRHLQGLDPTTGKTLWKSIEYRHFGTPLVVEHMNRRYLVTPGGDLIRPRDGKVLHGDLGFLWYVAPIWDDGKLFFLGNSSKDEVWKHLTGEGNRTPSGAHVFNGFVADGNSMNALITVGRAIEPFRPGTHLPRMSVLWERSLEGRFRRRFVRRDFYHAGAVLAEGRLHIVSSTGYLTVLDAKTGKLVFDKRLHLRVGTVTASPTLAGGLIHVVAENGRSLAFKPGPEYDLVQTNSLGPQRATPFFEGSRLYMRTLDELVCIEE